ncbi:MAG: D-tyrosyl-tRNA(Tyr) deacylase [Ruminococcaceae bacterium]|nr:D-tyrosyl-tRNA(Tyr) deacylase [Oscillospiraceae bacterium]
MRVVLQRVNYANVKVDGKIIGEIKKGYLALLGISGEDTKEIADKMVNKIKNLRLFDDEDGKTNLSISDVGGSLLVVSQFTLYADCKKGNRPSFTLAAKPDMAEDLYEYFLTKCTEIFGNVEHGSFGADMKVTLENDGPFTVILEM